MLAVALVLITGWLLASTIGTWAYFAGSPETEISPFNNYQKQLYQKIQKQRLANSQTRGPAKTKMASVNTFSFNS